MSHGLKRVEEDEIAHGLNRVEVNLTLQLLIAGGLCSSDLENTPCGNLPAEFSGFI
jgi:hypothetical protein